MMEFSNSKIIPFLANLEIAHMFIEIEDVIQMIQEMPRKFSFPNMKHIDGNSDSNEHIAQCRNRIFAVTILKDLLEAYMCKSS